MSKEKTTVRKIAGLWFAGKAGRWSHYFTSPETGGWKLVVRRESIHPTRWCYEIYFDDVRKVWHSGFKTSVIAARRGMRSLADWGLFPELEAIHATPQA